MSLNGNCWGLLKSSVCAVYYPHANGSKLGSRFTKGLMYKSGHNPYVGWPVGVSNDLFADDSLLHFCDYVIDEFFDYANDEFWTNSIF